MGDGKKMSLPCMKGGGERQESHLHTAVRIAQKRYFFLMFQQVEGLQENPGGEGLGGTQIFMLLTKFRIPDFRGLCSG